MSSSTIVTTAQAPTNIQAPANPPSQSLIVSGAKLYKKNTVGPLAGLTEVPFKQEEKPTHGWNGKKIPAGLWRQILSFFEWSYETTKSETMVNLFYHEDKGWVALVLPQAGYNGMTVALIPDHAKVPETYARLGEGWGVITDGGYVTGVMMGTVHHHCSASAFQSGTDKHDEQGTEGLHITIGHVGCAKYSIDARVSFNGTFTPANFADWFQLSPTIAELLPTNMHHEALVGFLTKKPPQITFPEWWKENVIKVERPTVIGFQQQYGQNGYYGGGNYCGDTRFPGHHNSGKKNKKNKNNGYTASYWFETKINEFCRLHNLTYKEILDKMNNIPKEYAPVIGFMIKNHRDVEEMNKDINAILDEQEPEETTSTAIVTASEAEQIEAMNQLYGMG